ncbi:LCP family protein [Georgenia muralis]|uniref:LytR family transcriptional attenuator n=1 Tax=Georgenia muralis TaxID=154117 RepID=A0A3N4Z5H7_9MICO|nr:LCP family protein [Georgenia muralis]RPF26380.1 LytR family transcriptional attenuator [Georgenia muralis]
MTRRPATADPPGGLLLAQPDGPLLDGRDQGAPGDHHAPADGAPDVRRTRRVLVAVAALVAVLGVVLVGAVVTVQQRVGEAVEWLDDPFLALPSRPPAAGQQAPDPAKGSTAVVATGAPLTALILGSDSRISAGDPDQWAYGAQRTDAIMLAQLSGDRENLTVMSLPRDSWVDVPGYGQAKLNAAFSWGGPTLMIQTVEQLTGVRVDHFAVADFESFSRLTDALGGVELTLPEGLDTRGQVYPPGTHVLDGEAALAYTRERYGLPGGDFDRVQRQQNWLRAIVESAVDENVLANPVRTAGLVTVVAESLAVDGGLGVDQMRAIALDLGGMERDDVLFVTAPHLGTGWSPDGTQSIVRLDDARLAEVSRAFAEDRVAELLRTRPDLATVLGEEVR